MKQLRTFRLLVVCIMMFCNLNLFADGLITEQVIVNVEAAGTLSTKISNADKYRITDLKIIGKLNGSDFDFVYTLTKGADKNLYALDLGEVELVADEDHEMPHIAFGKCTCLTSLILPESLTSIGVEAFLGCSGLTSLVFPKGLKSIGVGAFFGCDGLKSLVFEGPTSIGNYAFRSCKGLTSITFHSSSISLGLNSFRDCDDLHSLYITSNEYVEIKGLGRQPFSTDCVVYVPKGTLQTYKSSIWGTYFKDIVEYDATGIDDVSTSSSVKPLSRYSVNGQRLTTPAKGLNIVKYSDGSVRKEMVK